MARTNKSKNRKKQKETTVKKTKTAPRLKINVRSTGAAKAQTFPYVFDFEGLLIDKVLKNNEIADNGTAIENLIYNATRKMSDLGYSFGFSVGRQLALKQQGHEEFAKALDKIGLANVLYYPMRDRLIITSKQTGSASIIDQNIHIFECGIISGYLSVSTGIKMDTTESLCAHNGSSTCRFVSTPLANKMPESKIEITKIIDGISHSFTENKYRKTKNQYNRILAYLPLLEQPVFEEVRKLLFLSGERIAQYSDKKNAKRIINNIANYFGARDAHIEFRSKGKSIIKLRYPSYNSIYPYVAMPAAIISGYASKTLNKACEMSVSTNNDNTYTTTIEL